MAETVETVPGRAPNNFSSSFSSGAAVVCVTGASGFIGSWLVMRLLERGYIVRATVRNPEDRLKTKHLLNLRYAEERLSLWKGNLDEQGSFDAAFHGCHGIFHCAVHLDFESADPENEVIKPTVEGVRNVMQSCAKAKTIRRFIYVSSAGAVNFPLKRPETETGITMDESCWTDVDLCRKKQMTGWCYFVSKTLAERTAWELAEKHNLDMISVIPTLVVGPFISPSMPPSITTALALLTKNEPHYMILRQVQLVHLEDLCRSLIFLYEHPDAKGRCISSSYNTTIVEIARMLALKYKEFDIPTKFEDADENLKPLPYSSKKLTDLGFKFLYKMDDMFDGAIQTCLQKGLIQYPS